MAQNHYAGIGTRRLAPAQQKLCGTIGSYLAKKGWILHTGAAEGADQSFAKGALIGGGELVLHLPWPSYEENWFSKIPSQYSRSISVDILEIDRRGGVFDKEAYDSVFDLHPAPERLKRGAISLHARNYRILFPKGSPEPVQFVVAIPSPRGGGTAQGLRIAESLKIPTVRLDQLSAREARRTIDSLLSGSYGQRPDERGQNLFYAALPDVLPPDTSIAQAQAYLKQGAIGGTRCPCCGTPAKVKDVRFTLEMAAFLTYLVRRYEADEFNSELVSAKPADASLGKDLQLWKLIEMTQKYKAYLFRPTERGIQFVRNEIRVPDRVAVFNGRVVGWGEKLGYIKDIAGSDGL